MTWAAVLLTMVPYLLGRYVGYQRGYEACDFEHDFDRCPHCGEALP